MSNDSLIDRYGKPAVKIVVVFFAATALAAAAHQLQDGGVAAVGDAVVSIYVAGLLIYGVFYEAWGTYRFRVALYFGILLWGLVDYATGASLLTWVLIGGGGFFLFITVFREHQKKRKPVYER